MGSVVGSLLPLGLVVAISSTGEAQAHRRWPEFHAVAMMNVGLLVVGVAVFGKGLATVTC